MGYSCRTAPQLGEFALCHDVVGLHEVAVGLNLGGEKAHRLEIRLKFRPDGFLLLGAGTKIVAFYFRGQSCFQKEPADLEGEEAVFREVDDRFESSAGH